jgi:MoaA/NifB/PqqE/SkfB family radical SAM enzyme
MHPCPHLPFSFGNIREVSISDALERMSKDAMFKEEATCYINNYDFRDKYINPLLTSGRKLPVRI